MNIAKHPLLLYSNDIAELCRPLLKLNISYFAHVHIDNENNFSALNNNPAFGEHYLSNQYYNSDIHMAKKNQFGNYVIWDAFERTGKSLKMHSEAAELGVRHTFTIKEKDNTGSHFYHFATHVNSTTINQTYITQLDLLKIFIEYFKTSIKQTKSLLKSYDTKIALNNSGSGYTVNGQIIAPISVAEFTKEFNPAYYTGGLSNRQLECLYFLTQGMTQKQIAHALNLSPKTVEHYLSAIKEKTNCHSRSALIFEALKIPAIKEKL